MNTEQQRFDDFRLARSLYGGREIDESIHLPEYAECKHMPEEDLEALRLSLEERHRDTLYWRSKHQEMMEFSIWEFDDPPPMEAVAQRCMACNSEFSSSMFERCPVCDPLSDNDAAVWYRQMNEQSLLAVKVAEYKEFSLWGPTEHDPIAPSPNDEPRQQVCETCGYDVFKLTWLSDYTLNLLCQKCGHEEDMMF